MGPLGHSLAALAALGAAPPGLVFLLARPAARVGLRERLGLGFAPGQVTPGCVWVHAASVGEALAAARLVDLLRARGRAICVTTSTATGRDVLRRARPDLPCALAPLDHPWCVEAALARVRPAALVLVETELWPIWIRSAAARGVAVLSVSGRLSERSLGRWRRLPWLARGTAERLDAVGARSQADAERFVALGVPPERVRVTGDLKLEADAMSGALAPDLAAALAGAPILVAASTHAGEEEAAFAALAALESAGHAAVLLLAPRHPDRFGEVAGRALTAGRRVWRRSALGHAPIVPGDVLLLDSVGELPAIFAHASFAFVGGSLVPRGGHNVLEPARAGCPAAVGPHVENVADAVALLAASGALVRVADAAGLARACVEAFADPEAARERGERGRAVVAAAAGSAERSADLVDEILAARAGERRS
jgi:3-deoxy-D-manno-octulosonic-acid transferase